MTNHDSSCSVPNTFSIYLRFRFLILFSTLSLFLLLLNPTIGLGQSAVLSSGNYVCSAEYSLSYSIGEFSIHTLKNEGLTLTQGQQQSTLLITSVNTLYSNLELQAYPNPTSSYLQLKAANYSKPSFTISFTSLSGQLLIENKTLPINQVINMQKYISGIYFLQVSDDQGSILQTFKIVKQ